jgi:hypothetical protein
MRHHRQSRINDFTMTPEQIIAALCNDFSGVAAKPSWGETALFYNPGALLANGVYFVTLKEKDGPHDKASHLDRALVFRLAIGLTPPTYTELFGPRPARPPKGGVVATGHDFSQLNTLMPHPVYGWMGWAQILNPSRAQFTEILPLIEEAYHKAVGAFNKKTGGDRQT